MKSVQPDQNWKIFGDSIPDFDKNLYTWYAYNRKIQMLGEVIAPIINQLLLPDTQSYLEFCKRISFIFENLPDIYENIQKEDREFLYNEYCQQIKILLDDEHSNYCQEEIQGMFEFHPNG